MSRIEDIRVVIPNEERSRYHLVVDAKTHLLVRMYARQKKITLTTAACRLLTKAILDKYLAGEIK